ncbi:MAG: hypothetical protein ABH874_01845 [Methanobacteriota archaeon]
MSPFEKSPCVSKRNGMAPSYRWGKITCEALVPKERKHERRLVLSLLQSECKYNVDQDTTSSNVENLRSKFSDV